MLVILAVALLTVFCALRQLQPPSVVPASADAAEFSADRAMVCVRTITAQPHPVGSVANMHVREYLVAQLRGFGFDVTVQRTTAALAFGSGRAVAVENIVARKKGTTSSGAIMFSAHYDSELNAPGAGDNGYAVAGILEMLRALQSHPPLRNDLIVLFPDGEESGLLGARAFADELPLREEINVVFNFDGRGDSGPALMFETTEQNGWIVREFRNAVRHEVAFSVMTDLYRLLPNNTDFTFLKEVSDGGLNFAHIGGVENYHGVRDDADHLSERTLQDHGETMLDAALHFGNLDLKNDKQPDVVYFNFLWPSFVVYPSRWNVSLAIIVTVLFADVLFLALRRKQLHPIKLLIAVLLFLIRITLAGGVVFLLWKLFGPLQPEFGFLYLQFVYHGSWYLAGFIALALLIGLAFRQFAAERLGLFNIAIGALLVWLATCWLACLYLPNGSYLFVWPLMCSLCAVGMALWEQDARKPSLPGLIVVALCTIPGLYLYAQLIDLFYQGLTLLAAPVLAALVVFLLGTVHIQITHIPQRRPWIEPAVLFLAAVVCIVIALVRRAPSTEFPKPDSIAYLADDDQNIVRWITFDEKTDGWTQQFFPSGADTAILRRFFPSATVPVLAASAARASVESPDVEIVADRSTDSVRVLTVKVDAKNAIEFAAFTDLTDEIYDARVNGKPIESASKVLPEISRFLPRRKGPWSLFFYGGACELQLITRARAPLHLRIVTRSVGLPPEAMQGLNPRPAWTIPRPFYPTDMTLIGNTFVL